MKPPVARKAEPKYWKDRMPRQGRDPGDYSSVFDDIDDATRDDNVRDGLGPRPTQAGMKAGGKVKATGPVKVHKGEFVVRAAAAQKQGTRKMAALNAGKAKVVPKSGRR